MELELTPMESVAKSGDELAAEDAAEHADGQKEAITLFGTVSNSATSRISRNGRKYTAFGVAIISDRNLQAFHYNVVAFGKQGYFAKPFQTGTRIKLVVQAQSQPDNIASIPLLTATFVRPVRPVAVVPQ
jgi:hypothetical protein